MVQGKAIYILYITEIYKTEGDFCILEKPLYVCIENCFYQSSLWIYGMWYILSSNIDRQVYYFSVPLIIFTLCCDYIHFLFLSISFSTYQNTSIHSRAL